jgi:predicted Zn finger-like uncharacterized protein
MTIQVSCPHCRARFQLNESLQGKSVRCRECQEVFLVKPEDDLQDKVRAGNGPAFSIAQPMEEEDRPPPRRKSQGYEQIPGYFRPMIFILVALMILCAGFVALIVFLAVAFLKEAQQGGP